MIGKLVDVAASRWKCSARSLPQVTELAVIAFPDGRATLVETAPSVSVDDVVANTEAELVVPETVPEMSL